MNRTNTIERRRTVVTRRNLHGHMRGAPDIAAMALRQSGVPAKLLAGHIASHTPLVAPGADMSGISLGVLPVGPDTMVVSLAGDFRGADFSRTIWAPRTPEGASLAILMVGDFSRATFRRARLHNVHLRGAFEGADLREVQASGDSTLAGDFRAAHLSGDLLAVATLCRSASFASSTFHEDRERPPCEVRLTADKLRVAGVNFAGATGLVADAARKLQRIVTQAVDVLEREPFARCNIPQIGISLDDLRTQATVYQLVYRFPGWQAKPRPPSLVSFRAWLLREWQSVARRRVAQRPPRRSTA